MKKLIYVISVFVLILSVFTACGKSNREKALEHPNTSIKEVHSTTEAKFTVGGEKTSLKHETGKDKYEINYLDENGNSVKKEFYEKEKLKYYIEVSGADESGKSTQEKYYKPDGTLFGVFDGGFFYDGDGNQISEDVMEKNLYEAIYQ